jgi:hypothetical protein
MNTVEHSRCKLCGIRQHVALLDLTQSDITCHDRIACADRQAKAVEEDRKLKTPPLSEA